MPISCHTHFNPQPRNPISEKHLQILAAFIYVTLEIVSCQRFGRTSEKIKYTFICLQGEIKGIFIADLLVMKIK